MSKKTFMTTTMILAFLVSPVAGIFVRVADANPAPQSSSGEINIIVGMLSPENKTYNAPDVWLEVEAGGFPGIYYVGYSLDEEPFIELTTNSTRLYHTFYIRVLLEGLCNGTHHLVAKADVIFDIVPPACSEVYFTMLNSKTPSPSPTPTITPPLSPCPTPTPTKNHSLTVVVNSPQNTTYTSNDISITISASDPTLNIGPESVAYSIDGKPQVIIGTAGVGMHSLTNNTTLSLPNGVHTIVGIGITWFNGADGVFYSSTVTFKVESPTQQPTTEPSQTPDRPQIGDFAPAIIPGSTILLAIVVVGLLVYFGKRRE